eukprot:scaffold40663_cov63-Attheya_sp.AAC.1
MNETHLQSDTSQQQRSIAAVHVRGGHVCVGRMFGCDGYTTGYQQEGCDCLPSSQATKRVHQYVT